MKKRCFAGKRGVPLALLLCFALLLTGCGQGETREYTIAEPDFSFEMTPCKREDGEKFHIAFMDIYPPIESSYLCLKGLAEGLQSAGFLPETLDLSAAPEEFYAFYDYIAGTEAGEYLEFDPEPYIIGEDDAADEEIARQLRREVAAGELDVVVVTGTSCGRFMKDLDLPIPFLVCLATDPVAAGIIRSAEADGSENRWALVEPNPFGRQFEAYQRMLGIEKLLLLRVEEYAEFDGYEQYHEAAEKLGIECNDLVFTEDQVFSENYLETLLGVLDRVNVEEYDAVLFALEVISDDEAGPVSEFLSERKVPSLIGDGDNLVRSGGMLLLSCFDYEGYGQYAAMVLSNILHGQPAGVQPRIYTSSPYVLLNLTTAVNTGFPTSYELLRSADRIFR